MRYWPIIALGLFACSEETLPQVVQPSAYVQEQFVQEPRINETIDVLDELVITAHLPKKTQYQVQYETIKKFDPTIDSKIEQCTIERAQYMEHFFLNKDIEVIANEDLKKACTSLIIHQYY
jgi:hypothetical protein